MDDFIGIRISSLCNSILVSSMFFCFQFDNQCFFVTSLEVSLLFLLNFLYPKYSITLSQKIKKQGLTCFSESPIIGFFGYYLSCLTPRRIRRRVNSYLHSYLSFFSFNYFKWQIRRLATQNNNTARAVPQHVGEQVSEHIVAF